MRPVAALFLVVGLSLAAAAPGQPRAAATVKVAFPQGEQIVLFDRPGSTLEDAANALLAGPTAAERTRDVRTAIPAGTPLRSITQSGATATIDLGERFAQGTNADSLNARLTQVVLTLAAFRGVKYVRVLVKGGVPLGLFPGFPASRPLTAKDVERPTVAPPVPPAPGPVETEKTKASTVALQQRLADLGFLDPAAVDGQLGDRTKSAVMAFQKWEGLARDGDPGPATLKALETATRPRPLRSGGSGVRVEVLLDRQVALLIRDGAVVRVLPVASGAPGFDTPPGSYTVFRKEERSWSVPYKVWLPWASYFVGGIAFHESPDVPAQPASHGCVRTTSFDAEWLYRQIPDGTPVTVIARS